MTIRFNAKARQVIEAAQDECQKLGIVFSDLRRAGKHYKATLVIDGTRQNISLAVSPSDQDSAILKRAEIRRHARRIRTQ